MYLALHGHDCALLRGRRVIGSKSTVAVVQNIDISGVRVGDSYALHHIV